MSFFERVAVFLFEKPTEQLITTNTFLDPSQKQWIAFLRKDIAKVRISYEIQEHFRKKFYKVCHTGTSTVKVYLLVEMEEDEGGGSCVLFSILGTKKGERVLKGKYECRDPESFQIFGDLMHEFAENLAENLFFQSQQSEPFSADVENIQLISDPEIIPVQLQEVVHECVLHNQEEGIYVAFLHSGADRATVIKTLVERALEVGLEVENEKKSIVVITSPGKTDKLECKIGLNKSGERILQGKYDNRDSSIVFGSFLENFSIFLAKNQYLKSQVEIPENSVPEGSPPPSPTKPEPHQVPQNQPKKESYDDILFHWSEKPPTSEKPNLVTLFFPQEDEEEPPNLFAPKSVRTPGLSTGTSKLPPPTGSSRPPPSTATSKLPPKSTPITPAVVRTPGLSTGTSKLPPSTGTSIPPPSTYLSPTSTETSRPPPSTGTSQMSTLPLDPENDEPPPNIFEKIFFGRYSSDPPEEHPSVSYSGPIPKRPLFDEDYDPNYRVSSTTPAGGFVAGSNTSVSSAASSKTSAAGSVVGSVAGSVRDDPYLSDDEPPNLFASIPTQTTQPSPSPVIIQTAREESPVSVVVVPVAGLDLPTVGRNPSPTPVRSLHTSEGLLGKNSLGSEQGGLFMNFLKGVLSTEPEIKDEDDYRPSKKKQPTAPLPPEEEVDEEVLNSMPNPIWG